MGSRRRRFETGGPVPVRVRGGFSIGSVITGLVVALGVTIALTVLIGMTIESLGYDIGEIVRGETFWSSASAGTAVVVSTFLAFLWGGYTAGRMGRGAGVLHGILVPILTIIGTAVFMYIAIEVRGIESLDIPFGVGVLPIDADLTGLGVGVGAALAVALLLGGAWGGSMGARWHAKLEGLVPLAELNDTDRFADLRDDPYR